MVVINKDDIAVGDIIFLSNMSAGTVQIGYRPFFVLSRNLASLKNVHLLEISSQNKSTDQSKFPYNCHIIPSTQNGLNRESHVKCDQLFINCEQVLSDTIMKFGSLEKELFQDIQQRAMNADKNGDFYYYDQKQSGKTLRDDVDL